jgi:hypothetical protein
MLVVALAACGSTGGSDASSAARTGYISSPGAAGSQDIKIEDSGRVFGENFELVATKEGYRGLLRGQHTSMESTDGERVTGIVGGIPIDLHVEFDGTSLKAAGLFAGRLGRLQVDTAQMTSTFGRCSMELQRRAPLTYAGKRACAGGGIVPASLVLPPVFPRLTPVRQVMLLSTLLFL